MPEGVIRVQPGDEENWGGFEDAAGWMTEHSPPGVTYSRQRIYSLWSWRAGRGNGPGNGFPERRLVILPDGRAKEWFRKSEVLAWRPGRHPGRNVRKAA